MKKWFISLLALSVMLFGCSALKQETEQEKMEKVVTATLSNVKSGKYDSLDNSFQNMPARLASFIAFFSDENSNETITEFQQLIQKETAKMTYKVTDSTIDEDQGTGTVTVEITYIDLSTGIGDLAKTTLSSILDLFDSWMNKESSDSDIQEKLKEAFENMDENYTTSTVTFNMIKVDDNWMIGETDSTFVDIICGNAYTDMINLLNSFLNQ